MGGGRKNKAPKRPMQGFSKITFDGDSLATGGEVISCPPPHMFV